MNFEIGQTVYGFRLREKQELAGHRGTGYVFVHEKSGARLFYIQNDDDNKVFYTAFRTPPADSTGVAHILEHSVLCGSRKYPLKDPFNQLLKGSLNTYLNAMTYGDKTVYPVASRNEKDFKNLMDVYLDAVFFPRIYEQKEIFLQEGWRLEEGPRGLNYNGVVYNEMKGALSDPERLLMNAVNRELFPTSIYQYESGGDPRDIPHLSYEAFLDFHRAYYHPSNCIMYLYGDMEVGPYLQKLDEEYLSGFTARPVDSEILPETELPRTALAEAPYPAAEGDGAFLAYSVLAGPCTDPVRNMAMGLLDYMLLETNASPLKRALEEAGIGDQCEGWFDGESRDTVFSVVAKNARPEQEADFARVIKTTLTRLAETGFDPALREATLARYEYMLREQNFGYRPKGLVYGLRLLKSALHDQSFFAYLHDWETFAQVKQLDFAALVREVFLENPHVTQTVLRPDTTLAEKLRREDERALAELTTTLSAEEREALRRQAEALRAFQTKEETEAELACIPCLALSDVSPKADFVPVEPKNGVLQGMYETNGIVYLQLVFPATEDEAATVGLLRSLLTELGTKAYSRDELAVKQDLIFGQLFTSSRAYQTPEGCLPALMVEADFLAEKKAEAFAFLKEVLTATDFDNREDVGRTLREARQRLAQTMADEGHLTALQRAMGHLDAREAWQDASAGSRFYPALKAAAENPPENLGVAAQRILSNGFLALVGGGDACEAEIAALRAALPGAERKARATDCAALRAGYGAREALTTPGKVVYVAKAGDYRQAGFEYSGTMLVARSLINRAYLWDRVRVLGGAYGCGVGFRRSGMAYFYSYRDPHLNRTLAVYDQTGDFLQGLTLSEQEVTRYILGAINELDRPRHASELGDVALRYYLAEITEADVNRERQQVLDTKLKDLQALAPLFGSIAGQKQVCAVGDAGILAEGQEMFDKTGPLV